MLELFRGGGTSRPSTSDVRYAFCASRVRRPARTTSGAAHRALPRAAGSPHHEPQPAMHAVALAHEPDRAGLAIECIQIRAEVCDPWTQDAISSSKCKRGKPASIQGNHDDHQKATSGVHARSTRRQSMPSRSIDSCARLSRTTPLSAFGQMKRPRSRRLANRQRPSPSHQRSFTMSPLRLRNTNTCPENG